MRNVGESGQKRNRQRGLEETRMEKAYDYIVKTHINVHEYILSRSTDELRPKDTACSDAIGSSR